jgi:hypothetical protein
MDELSDYTTKKELWNLLVGPPPSELHDEEYWAQRALMTKWLVYYDHFEDCTFTPVAIVEAKNEEEACSNVSGSGIRLPEGMVPIHARRFTLDGPEDVMDRVIECVDCGQMKKSINGVFCPSCLDLFMGISLDGISMVRK